MPAELKAKAVSIHTPTKGVTFLTPGNKGYKISFNPHTHEGCDLVLSQTQGNKKSFNPHTHEGCDRAVLFVSKMRMSFNPHTHEGCDVWHQAKDVMPPSFNPHTHEGCDGFFFCAKALKMGVSIHTPTKGVTSAQALPVSL